MGTKREMPPLPVTCTQPTMDAHQGARGTSTDLEGKQWNEPMEGKGVVLPSYNEMIETTVNITFSTLGFSLLS